ncbi:ArpU family phage packaging/lysis transcriptional regulator [Lacticaseibacillus paracasei]|uniref:ArpU family phage packaging/lysis transcriptional regulator n=1 Tax=Lacticaseibacillus paracasei TaxID=1597 RepID=UPI0031F51DE8
MVRATRYFSPIDHDKTIENAKEVLGNYWHHKRLAQRTKMALRSPVMDGMPKSPSYGNKAEEKVISHADELRYVACCEIAIRSVELEKYRIILTETYLVSLDQRKPWWLIAEELHLSKSAYYRDFKEALLAFADWCELVEQPHKT